MWGEEEVRMGREGILGSNGWLSRCVSPAEPMALRVVTQFLLSLCTGLLQSRQGMQGTQYCSV